MNQPVVPPRPALLVACWRAALMTRCQAKPSPVLPRRDAALRPRGLACRTHKAGRNQCHEEVIVPPRPARHLGDGLAARVGPQRGSGPDCALLRGRSRLSISAPVTRLSDRCDGQAADARRDAMRAGRGYLACRSGRRRVVGAVTQPPAARWAIGTRPRGRQTGGPTGAYPGALSSCPGSILPARCQPGVRPGDHREAGECFWEKRLTRQVMTAASRSPRGDEQK